MIAIVVAYAFDWLSLGRHAAVKRYWLTFRAATPDEAKKGFDGSSAAYGTQFAAGLGCRSKLSQPAGGLAFLKCFRPRSGKYALSIFVSLLLLWNSIPLALSGAIEPAAMCRFSTYSLQIKDDDGEAGFPETIAYIAATLAPFLKLISPDAQLAPAKSTLADVQITYVLSDYRYKTPYRTGQKTVFDLLADLPVPGTEVRTLTSPWLQLYLTPSCKLTAVFIWNKRQIIADQAFLAGIRPLKKGIVTPINDPDLFLPKEYERSVILLGDYTIAVPGGKVAERSSVALDKQQQVVKQFVAHKYPPDLFWFFSLIKTDKSFTDSLTFGSQLIDRERELSRHANEYQSALAIAVADRFTLDNSQQINFESILDAGSLVDLNKYRNEKILKNYP